MNEVNQFLSQIDILVVPSITTDDGWGVVISEALLAGVAVVASEKVGASKCLYDDRGEAVRELTPQAFAAAIDAIVLSINDDWSARRNARSSWAVKHLTVEAGVAYLFEAIHNSGKRPLRYRAFITDCPPNVRHHGDDPTSKTKCF